MSRRCQERIIRVLPRSVRRAAWKRVRATLPRKVFMYRHDPHCKVVALDRAFCDSSYCQANVHEDPLCIVSHFPFWGTGFDVRTLI